MTHDNPTFDRYANPAFPWIRVYGKGPPMDLAHDQRLLVLQRNGKTATGELYAFRWHYGRYATDSRDAIAYVLQPVPANIEPLL